MRTQSITPRKGRVIRNCEECGVLFAARQNMVNRGRDRYCSKPCADAAWTLTLDVQRARFWARVDKTSSPHGCWLWTGPLGTGGYGNVQIGGHKYNAHRFAYIDTYGPISAKIFVCHDCPGGDNPLCCNPEHMFLDTGAGNTRDAARKGRLSKGDQHFSRTQPERLARGAQNGGAKMSEEDARDVLRRLAEGTGTPVSLAAELHVSDTQIRRIRSGKSWRHLR